MHGNNWMLNSFYSCTCIQADIGSSIVNTQLMLCMLNNACYKVTVFQHGVFPLCKRLFISVQRYPFNFSCHPSLSKAAFSLKYMCIKIMNKINEYYICCAFLTPLIHTLLGRSGIMRILNNKGDSVLLDTRGQPMGEIMIKILIWLKIDRYLTFETKRMALEE